MKQGLREQATAIARSNEQQPILGSDSILILSVYI